MYDIKFKNVSVIDGTGKAARRSDVAVAQGIIVALGNALDGEAIQVIEGEGLSLSPGFIDMHSHCDLLPFREEPYRSSRIHQGITTDCAGQCGLGPAPYTEDIRDWKDCVTPVVGDAIQASWAWPRFGDFLDELDRQPMLHNQAMFIAHGAIRANAVGLEDVPLTRNHLGKMQSILEEALDAGAFGASFGLSYLPGMYAQQEEIMHLAHTLAKRNRVFMVHIRSHSLEFKEAVQEMIEISRRTGVKMHLSHLKSYGNRHYGTAGETILQWLEPAWEEGLSITYDEHPYRGGSTMLSQVLPPWMRLGGSAEMVMRLQDEGILSRLVDELTEPVVEYPGWDNFSAIAGWDNIVVSSIENPVYQSLVNHSISEIAQEMNLDPVRAAAWVLVRDEGRSAMVMLDIFRDDDLAVLMSNEHAMVGSDGIPTGKSHPRLFGAFPLFLQKMVREQKVLSLEKAIHRITGLSADRLGIGDRGLIREGQVADLVLFSPDHIGVQEDYLHPMSQPTGIHEVFVQGKPAQLAAGQVLRAGRS